MRFVHHSIAAIAATTAFATAADVRVAHMSPDAPAVDVLVNGAPAFTNAPFGAITDYAQLPAGQYLVQVVPSGQLEPVVIEANIELPESGDFTVAAINELANISASIFEDDNQRTTGISRVRFIHTSPGTPAVDIAIANNGAVLFPNVSYGQSGGYIEVPGGTYDLEARVAGTDTVALSLPGVTFESGTSVTVWANGLLKGTPSLGVSVSIDVAPTAKLRVVHASPDAPPVDVKVNGTRVIETLAFNSASNYASLDTGTYDIDVVPSGLNDPIVIDATLDLAAEDYTVLAINTLDQISPLVLIDNNNLTEDAMIRFVHASPDAPAVDIALANGGPVLFSNISFGQTGSTITVPSGTYDLEARVAGTSTVALDVPGVNVTGNRSFTVIATGLLNGIPNLNAIALLDAEACQTDVIGNGMTGSSDILALLDKWGSDDVWADVDHSGNVDIDDLMMIISNYGTCIH